VELKRHALYLLLVAAREIFNLNLPDPPKKPTPAPAWVALLAAWLGLLALICSLIELLLPDPRDPAAELKHLVRYSWAGRFLPVPIYGSTVAIFVGIIVLWQMRKEPRPFSSPLRAQRIQASVGIGLGILAAVIIDLWYIWFHFLDHGSL
jgi:hypothetical protein